MSSKMTIKQSTISALFLAVFFFIAVLLGGSIYYMNSSIKSEQSAEKRRTEYKQLGINLADASDYLTDEARKFAVTTEIEHLLKYWDEINVIKTRDHVISRLEEMNSPAEEKALLAEAKRHSDDLVETERRSMRLVMEAQGVDESNMVPEIASFHLSQEDRLLDKEGKLAKARDIMFDTKYAQDKESIMKPIETFQEIMNARLDAELELARRGTTRASILQTILSIIIICAVAILIRIMFTQVTFPIQSYTGLLNKFSFGDESFSLHPQGTKELQMLATTFNQLYTSLKDELIKRKQAEETMKIAKEEAEQANNAKSEFLANMSHEIRTPLNTIIGYHYLLEENTTLIPKQKEYSSKIGIAAKNLLDIINEILDFSKIEAGKMAMEKINFNLYKTIQDICGMVHIEAERKGLELSYEIEEAVPEIIAGDVTRLRQVILNLLSNAIKFTHEGSIKVIVKQIEKSSEQITIGFSVTDTGIGIAMDKIESLFEVFSQGDASTSRKYGGTGLGLAICKRIVELMGGSINVESQMGKGSVFSFSAVFGTAEGAVLEKLETIENKNAEIMNIFKGKKVLLVEDNQINLQMTKEILESLGFETDTADSGAMAIQNAISARYDAILMDIRMPEMDGYEATRRLREENATRDVPIIALSADAVEGVAEKAKTSGMNGYITKPLEPSKLIEILKNYVGADNVNKPFIKLSSEEVDNKQQMDFQGAIDRLGGKSDRYKNIVEQFIENHSLDPQIIDKFISAGDYEEAGRHLHTIKGIAGYIGAMELKEKTQLLEKAVSDRDENDIKALKKGFMNSFNNSLLLVKDFIDNIPEAAYEDGDKNTDKHFNDVLAELLSLLQDGNWEVKKYFEDNKDILKGALKDEIYYKIKSDISLYNLEEAEYEVSKAIEHTS